MNSARFLSRLTQQGIKARYSLDAFSVNGRAYDPGTIVVNRGDNRLFDGDLNAAIQAIAQETKQDTYIATTGFVTSGRDLGSDGFKFIHPANILLLTGDETSANAYGQVWHYFEDAVDYPITAITNEQLGGEVLANYNVLILPEGYYKIADNTLDEIKNWVRKGGRVIAIGRALNVLKGKDGFNLQQYASESEEDDAKKAREKEELDNRMLPYAGQDRRAISYDMHGAIFKVNIDQTHPLGFGLGQHYFSLKTSTQKYQLLKNTWNVGTIDKEAFHLGFAGEKALHGIRETTVFAVQDMGSGSVVYMVDNPLFRGFWEEGKLLFSNAVFLR